MSAAAPGKVPAPKTFYLRDLSGGANVSTGRESIKDNEAFYMEGLQPIAPGHLKPLLQADVTTMAALVETADPTYAMSFQVSGVPYIFAVFGTSGNGYVINMNTLVSTKIFNGTLTSGTTCAAQWNKQGILIVDPTGYWDWNVSTALLLTSLDRSVQSVTIKDPGSAYTLQPTVAFAGGGGAGAAATAYLGLGVVAIAAGGAGYNVGDILTIPGAGSVANGTVAVATIGGGGAVATLSIVSAGQYIAGGLPGAAAATTGGAGNGCTINCTLFVSAVTVTNRGAGYTSAPTATLVGGGPPTRVGALTANITGSLGGTAIAAYAGRAWIANGRTVTFTDAGSYASFIGSGSQFTIDDSYLVNNITALFAANSYLYIFGPTSIDVLSNVTVSGGVASFSRVNVNPVVGCNYPKTIFGYYRSVAFANGFGFYMLTGATVDNISENKLELMLPFLSETTISGFPVTLNGQLCAAWSGTVGDVLNPGSSIELIVIFNKGRWFFARQATDATHILTPRCTVTIAFAASGFKPYTFDRLVNPSNTRLYALFDSGATAVWRLYTKLYDMGAPMMSKQVTRVGLALNFPSIGGPLQALSFSAYSELGSGVAVSLPTGATGGYHMYVAAQTGLANNSKYVGWIASVQANGSGMDRLPWLAMEYVETNPWQ